MIGIYGQAQEDEDGWFDCKGLSRYMSVAHYLRCRAYEQGQADALAEQQPGKKKKRGNGQMTPSPSGGFRVTPVSVLGTVLGLSGTVLLLTALFGKRKKRRK